MIDRLIFELDYQSNWMKRLNLDLKFKIQSQKANSRNLKEFLPNQIISVIEKGEPRLKRLRYPILVIVWILITGVFIFKLIDFFSLPLNVFVNDIASPENIKNMGAMGYTIYFFTFLFGVEILLLYGILIYTRNFIKGKTSDHFSKEILHPDNLKEYGEFKEDSWYLVRIPFTWDSIDLIKWLNDNIDRNFFRFLFVTLGFFLITIIGTFSYLSSSERFFTFLLTMVIFLILYIIYLWFELIRDYVKLSILKRELLDHFRTEKRILRNKLVKELLSDKIDSNEKEFQFLTLIDDNIKQLESVRIISSQVIVGIFSIIIPVVSNLLHFIYW